MNVKKLIIFVIIALILIGIGITVFTKLQQPSDNQEVIIPDIIRQTKYGLYIEDWNILEDTVKSGDFLGIILNKYGISSLQIHKISKQNSDTFKVTTIHTGQPFFVFCDKDDTLRNAKYFVYENSKTRYTRYNFTVPDTIIIEKFNKKVDTVECSAYGIIESSLWNTLIGQGYSWNIAIALSQTFAWSVDFYALQKGDWFKVIYDDLLVEGQTIDQPNVKAGIFYHGDRELWSIPFKVRDTSNISFYDTLGNSMKRSFLKSPLKFTRISSRYSNARMHPILHRPTAHLAVDFVAPCGTPIYAACDGTIVYRGWDTGGGNVIKIRHNKVYSTVYMHISSFGNYFVGQYVRQGETIGYVGSTGWSTGCHLHYEVHENGKQIDPLSFMPPPTEPIDSANMPRFNIEKRTWIDKINKIKIYKSAQDKEIQEFLEQFDITTKKDKKIFMKKISTIIMQK